MPPRVPVPGQEQPPAGATKSAMFAASINGAPSHIIKKNGEHGDDSTHLWKRYAGCWNMVMEGSSLYSICAGLMKSTGGICTNVVNAAWRGRIEGGALPTQMGRGSGGARGVPGGSTSAWGATVARPEGERERVGGVRARPEGAGRHRRCAGAVRGTRAQRGVRGCRWGHTGAEDTPDRAALGGDGRDVGRGARGAQKGHEREGGGETDGRRGQRGGRTSGSGEAAMEGQTMNSKRDTVTPTRGRAGAHSFE